MNISLNEHWKKFVDTQLSSGRYGSASEVVRDGLRLLEERERILHAKIQQGINSPVSEWNVNEFLDKANKKALQMKAKK